MSLDSKHIKIVYLVGGPITQRWLDYYQVDEMAKVFDVEFWNCSAILDDGYIVTNPIRRDYVVTIDGVKDYKRRLKRLPKDTIAVIEIGLVERNYAILKRASKSVTNGVIIDFWTYFMWDAVKEISEPQLPKKEPISKFARLKALLYKSDVLWLVSRLIKCRSTKQMKSVYLGCKKRIEDRRSLLREEQCKSLFHLYEMTYKPHQSYTINHPDYEKYLLIKDKKERTDRYIVFIADFYPYHPEIILREGYNQKQVAKEYYDSLNRFFDKVEKQLNCKVVIAEHPSGKWEHNPFNGREIVYYKTADLVRDSIGVCLHSSCAISYAALFDKPVFIIYTKALEASSILSFYTPVMANALQREICEIDNIEDTSNIFLPIDENVRQRYIHTFADADSNKLNAERMKEHFINIHNEIIKSQS